MTTTTDNSREVVRNQLLLGELGGKAKRFAAWHHSLDPSLHKFSHAYVRRYDHPEKWMFSTWLALTAKGELLARSIEAKDIDEYRRVHHLRRGVHASSGRRRRALHRAA